MSKKIYSIQDIYGRKVALTTSIDKAHKIANSINYNVRIFEHDMNKMPFWENNQKLVKRINKE